MTVVTVMIKRTREDDEMKERAFYSRGISSWAGGTASAIGLEEEQAWHVWRTQKDEHGEQAESEWPRYQIVVTAPNEGPNKAIQYPSAEQAEFPESETQLQLHLLLSQKHQ